MESVMIPVFFVLKNGTMIKNIFLNSPSPESGEHLSISRDDDPILIGRHPDCHIVVDHPSISRFHLEIRFNSSSKQLFATDQSSVHGTWVSGKKIHPNMLVELIEGDTVRLGASTRIYRLHWMPLSHAFEMEKLMPPLMEEASYFLDRCEALQDENLHKMKTSFPGKLSPRDLEENDQTLIRKEMLEYQFKGDQHKSFKSIPGNNIQFEGEKHSPLMVDRINKSSRLLLRRNKSISFLQIEQINKENGCEITNAEQDFEIEEQMFGEFVGWDEEEKCPLVLSEGNAKKERVVSFVLDKEEMAPVSFIGLKALESEKRNRTTISNSCLLNGDFMYSEEQKVGHLEIYESETPSFFFERGFVNEKEESLFISNKDREIGETFVSCFSLTDKEVLEIKEQKVKTFVNGNGEKSPKGILINSYVKGEEKNTLVSDEKKVTSSNSMNTKVSKGSIEMKTSPLISFHISYNGEVDMKEQKLTDIVEENEEEKIPSTFYVDVQVKEEENDIPLDTLNISIENCVNSWRCNSGVEASSLSPLNTFNFEKEALISDMMKLTSKSNKLRTRSPIINKKDSNMFDGKHLESLFATGNNLQRSLFKLERSPLGEKCSLNVENKFLSDLGNCTPKTPKSLRSEKSIAKERDDTFASDKENLTPQSLKLTTSKSALPQSHCKTGNNVKRKERIPFQPLFVSSTLQNISYPECTDETFINNYAINVQNFHKKTHERKEVFSNISGREKKKWYIVVDVGCFLLEESRKSLQLLEGIKGTQLIIPRIVIRELDHLNRSQGILTRGTEASSILQWIEESMVKNGRWIHVQSSFESLPSATPRSQICDGGIGINTYSSNFVGFSTCGTLMEIVSLTSEDHILECALLFKRVKDDGQLVLLTSSITLKIKAMAEGLLCETPKEFRESLVNPLSKRFLWANSSSPRGSIPCCIEEIGLPKSGNQQFAPAKTEEIVKGLKLLLRANYGMDNSACSSPT